ncbi:hypothetical protein QZH41_007120 [Actinostola sp. cb2023]|nr:hypothetical protein QZH41_007120 [Actinostola sp. cb2023]
MNLLKGLTNAFHNLSTESRELYLSSEVPVISTPPSPLQFYRNWVTPNIPVIIQNNINHWPALGLWDSDYFRKKIGDKEVTVAVTPNGYADAVVGDQFVMPEERTMKMGHFLDILDHEVNENGIFYIQKQNSNFTEEFSEIIQDAALDIPWASEAFGKLPDAVNFWMGDGRAVTSMHKDHYENLYCVVSGSKTFTLIPPSDLPFVTYGLYKPAKYQLGANGDFGIVEEFQSEESNVAAACDEHERSDEGNGGAVAVDSSDGAIGSSGSRPVAGDTSVSDKDNRSDERSDNDVVVHGDDDNKNIEKCIPWVSIDPLNPDFQSYPDYAKARPITCTVNAGDTLYLPSLWFHHVQQSHKCIAVNFWYDMDYDIKYSYYKFLESLTKLVKQ